MGIKSWINETKISLNNNLDQEIYNELLQIEECFNKANSLISGALKKYQIKNSNQNSKIEEYKELLYKLQTEM